MEFLSKSLEETKNIAKNLIEEISKLNSSTPVFVLLSGDLGSGKTAFVKCVGDILGITETITSPTFVIEKIYKTKDTRFSTVVHIDAYRLEDEKEVSSLGWNEILKYKNAIVFVEWPEMLPSIFSKDSIKIEFEFIDEETRKIILPKI